jgi:Putative F0F1-ATPase subunit Ca2+/Mg2+ transporter
LNPKHKPVNKWLQLIGIPIQMGIVIYLFAYFGQWLDVKYPNEDNLYTKLITMLGVFISLYLVIQQVKKVNG